MQFTKKSREHMDACRFCWMCRHICPIGNATGLERNTSRARALGLSLVARDTVEYSENIINNVYECSLCGACVKECVTGWDPVFFTKEARLHAALEGKTPEYILNMVEKVESFGNIYGVNCNCFENVAKKHTGADMLFFVGEDAASKLSEKALLAIELLDRAGVKFDVLTNEPNSGYSMDFMISATQETKSIMEKCAEIIGKYKTIVCYDPADAKIMKREYKEWGIDLKSEVITFTSYISKLINDGQLKVKQTKDEFTPQDSFLLARDLEETAPIREVLSSCGKVNEMLLNGKDTMLAGNLIMNEYMPDVMEKVARNRWINAINMNTKILVTSCPAEYVMLEKTKPENVLLMTLEEVVLKCL